jgi:hypothetical protein
MARQEIREYAHTTTFAGDFPEIALYADVQLDLLTAGDEQPFFVTLAVAEVGRVSSNGLLYDEDLVMALARQLQGSGGIRGHIPSGAEGTAFPVDVVDWVGHVLLGTTLWAKAYVPPGDTREYIRRLKGRGGKLGTSIYGYGEREALAEDESVWRSKNFELHSLDLAAAKMASLDLGGQFAITSETTHNKENNEEGTMPISLEDVPDAVREQIIQQSSQNPNHIRDAHPQCHHRPPHPRHGF